LITLSKIAALAHVSVSTASKAFSMSSEVNEQTREMIFKIAKEQGCFKKFFNAKYPKFVVAVICPEYKSLFYSSALSMLQEYLSEYGCEVCVASTNFSAQTEADLLEYYSQYSAVDGIIVINGSAAIDPHLGLPVVTLYPNQGCAGPISIRGDISAAITAAFAHFRSRNVTDIGFIGDPQTFLKQQLLAKFGEALGMPLREKYICISDARFEAGGYAAMETFFKAGNLPQAIFCAYDYMAIGAIRCILDHGLSVPNDIAVIGMDDIPEAKYLNPSLSSINVNMDKTCRIAAEAIIRCLTEQPFALSEKVTCDLHLRASTDIK